MRKGLTKDGIDRAVSRICLIPFFPSSDLGARSVIQEELLTMCESDAAAFWLSVRMGQAFRQWPGVGEMRALYCKRFKPRDGIEVESQIYPDGFPSELQLGPLNIPGLLPARSERDALESAKIPMLLLEDGHVSADAEGDAIVLDLVPLKAIPPMPEYHHAIGAERRVESTLREILHLDPLPVEPATSSGIFDLNPPVPEPQYKNSRPSPEMRLAAEKLEADYRADIERKHQRVAEP